MSVVKETRTRGRPANSARAQRQQHLETLRRRRAGNKEDAAESDSESEAEDSDTGDEPESPLHRGRIRNNEADSDVESSIASNEDLDRYEDDFVQEDPNDELGVPTDLNQLPFEFSRHAYKQLKDYFQDAIEWMIHNQLNPAFPRSDARYQFAFVKLDDEVRGWTGSQLLSSAWNVNFRRALVARPHLEVTPIPASDENPCDACNRSNHPATSALKLYGNAYSLETLEALRDYDSSSSDTDSDDDSDSDKEAEQQDEDRDGNILPDQTTRFLLGKSVSFPFKT